GRRARRPVRRRRRARPPPLRRRRPPHDGRGCPPAGRARVLLRRLGRPAGRDAARAGRARGERGGAPMTGRAIVRASWAGTAARRPNTSVVFGILVPVYGLAMCGLWSARYGTFPRRRPARGVTRRPARRGGR